MMPILYQENETNFNHNGIGVLFDTESYRVTEERNGPYELELVYPAGGRWASEIKDFRLISAKPNEEDESHIFRIYEIVKDLEEDTITIFAATKSNELGGNLVQGVVVNNVSAQVALDLIKDNLVEPTNYTFVSDIQTLSSGDWDNVSPLSAIVGDRNSVITQWGGEVKRTDDTIYVYARRGTDKVTTIRQGKGLDGFKMTTSIKGLITSILPYFIYTPKDSESPVIVKGSLVNSPLMNNYPVRHITAFDCSQYDDILPVDDNLDPLEYHAQLLNNLNTLTSSYFTEINKGCDEPKVTIEVDLSKLSDSSDYIKFKDLEHIKLTDTVIVWVERFNVDVEVTINEVTYDGMSKRVVKLVAGSAKSGIITDSEKRYTDRIDKVMEYVNTVENGIYNSIRISADSKNNIFSGFTTPDETLVKFDDIWYKPVADGEIEMYRWDGNSWVLAVVNADKIAIGTIDASKINVINMNASNLSVGRIVGTTGYWDLDSGEFKLGDPGSSNGILWNGASLTIRLAGGQTIEEYVSDSIIAADVEYYLSTSKTALTGGSWSSIAPEWTEGKYMWTRTTIQYKDGSLEYRPSINGTCIAGATGKGVSSVQEYYLATSASSGVTTATSGWTTAIQTMTVTNKYLWNYEKINFSDGSSQTTTPVIIGVYGNTGATGRALTAVTEYYLASNLDTGVTRATAGWTTSMQLTDTTKKYLWNYEKLDWSVDPTTTYVEPVIIGVHGATGPDGRSITSVDVQYYLSTSATALAEGSWSTSAPTWVDGKYIWSKTVTTYSTGNPTESTPVCITGGKGSTGTGITSVTEEYAISSSKTTAPTTFSTTRPTWEPGKYIWTRNKIVYNNPTSTVYTSAIPSTEWEAVNEIQVGGRNLLIRSGEITDSTINQAGYVETLLGSAVMADYIEIGAGEYITITKKDSSLANNTMVFAFYNSSDALLSRSILTASEITVLTPTNSTKMRVAYPIDSYPKVELGNVATGWGLSPEDLESLITARATTGDVEELGALVESFAGAISGKASAGALEALVNEYNTMVQEENTNKENVAQALATLNGRTASIETTLGNQKAKWNFIDTVISGSEEGIFVGNESEAMGILIAPNRISLMDKGVEVAYISNKTMEITHGIFVKSAIIGKHKISTMEDSDITVFTYVG